MKHVIWVGIDISKSKLDIYRSDDESHQVMGRTRKGVGELCEKLGPDHHVVLEASGGYEKLVVEVCLAHHIKVSFVNPQRARSFAKGMNMLAKTDKIDAKVLAMYGKAIEPVPYQMPSPERQELQKWVRFRQAMLEQKNRMHNQQEHADAEIAQHLEQVMDVLNEKIASADETIHSLLHQEPTLSEKAVALQEIKGVGIVTVATLLAELPELGEVSGKAVASLCGVSPVARDSGTSFRRRRLGPGRRRLKRVLCLAAQSARRHNPVYRCFYERLLAKGKSVMTATLAVARKILCHMNAMMRDNTRFQPVLCQPKVIHSL